MNPDLLPETKAPLYWRALRLRHLRPNGWQRALLVKGHDVLAGLLGGGMRTAPPPEGVTAPAQTLSATSRLRGRP